MNVNIDECKKAGIDPKTVERIAKGLSRYGREARCLGITLFGGSGTGQLRFNDNTEDIHSRSLVLATFDGHVDGGDGACQDDEEGFLRGE